MADDDIIRLLHTLQRPTLFTADLDFYKRHLCDERYALVYLAVKRSDLAHYVRALLHHPRLDTQAKRMGAVVRADYGGLSVWRPHALDAERISWE